jgi:23S rRNA pseudouridine1911/1915/1917 synthase
MNDPEQETIIITQAEAGQRLDRILANRFSEVKSRTYFQMLINEQHVLLNGQPVKKRIKPNEGDEVEIYFTLTPEIDIAAENIPLNIVYEDDHILVINKPAGMVVHPAPGNWSGTFVNALLYHCKNLPGDVDNLRPGIVHRLDKETTGILVAAKSSLAQQRLIELFAGREVHKEYIAICLGNPGEGEFKLSIGRHPVHRKKMAILDSGGRSALTKYKTVAFDGKISLVDVAIETGRTHQIRVHLSHHRTPVLGDSLYGNLQANKKYNVERQLLHARLTRFNHPITKKPMEFIAEIPMDMEKFTSRLQREFAL